MLEKINDLERYDYVKYIEFLKAQNALKDENFQTTIEALQAEIKRLQRRLETHPLTLQQPQTPPQKKVLRKTTVTPP